MAGGLVAAGGLAGLHRLGHTRKEPLGPGVPVPWLTPVGSFYVTAGKELPPLIAEATTSLRVRSGGVVKQLPWEDLRALATLQVERTLLCDGAGFEIRSLGAPDHTLLHWNWRFAAIGNARWDCIPLDRLFDALRFSVHSDRLQLPDVSHRSSKADRSAEAGRGGRRRERDCGAAGELG